jgi:hypothetical protein
MFEDVLDQDVDQLDDMGPVVIQGRWSLDGARSLQDAVEMAKEQVNYFEQLIEMGYELEGIVDDDYGVARKV